MSRKLKVLLGILATILFCVELIVATRGTDHAGEARRTRDAAARRSAPTTT